MGSDWIDKFEVIDNQRKTSDELRLHKARIVREKLPDLWRELVKALQSEAQRYREKFPLNHIEGPGDHAPDITIRKPTYPIIVLKLKHRVNGTQIPYEWQRQHVETPEITSRDNGNIAVLIDDNDNAYLSYPSCKEGRTPLDIARCLLSELVESFHRRAA